MRRSLTCALLQLTPQKRDVIAKLCDLALALAERLRCSLALLTQLLNFLLQLFILIGSRTQRSVLLHQSRGDAGKRLRDVTGQVVRREASHCPVTGPDLDDLLDDGFESVIG